MADSGIYVCQAQVGNEVVRDNVTLTVGGESLKLFLEYFCLNILNDFYASIHGRVYQKNESK